MTSWLCTPVILHTAHCNIFARTKKRKHHVAKLKIDWPPLTLFIACVWCFRFYRCKDVAKRLQLAVSN